MQGWPWQLLQCLWVSVNEPPLTHLPCDETPPPLRKAPLRQTQRPGRREVVMPTPFHPLSTDPVFTSPNAAANAYSSSSFSFDSPPSPARSSPFNPYGTVHRYRETLHFRFSLLLLFCLLLLSLPAGEPARGGADLIRFSPAEYLAPTEPVRGTTLFPGQTYLITWDREFDRSYFSPQQLLTIELVRQRRTPRMTSRFPLRQPPSYNQNVTIVHTITTNMPQRNGSLLWEVPAYWARDFSKFGGAYYIRIRPADIAGRNRPQKAFLDQLPLFHSLYLNTKDTTVLGYDEDDDDDDDDDDFRIPPPALPQHPSPPSANNRGNSRNGSSRLGVTPPRPPPEPKKGDDSEADESTMVRYKIPILACVIAAVVLTVIIIMIVCLGPRRRAHWKRKAALEAVNRSDNSKFGNLNKDFGSVIDTSLHLPRPLPSSQLHHHPYAAAPLSPSSSSAAAASSSSSASSSSLSPPIPPIMASASPLRSILKPVHPKPSSHTAPLPPPLPSTAPPALMYDTRRASRQDVLPDHLWRSRLPLEGIAEQEDEDEEA